MKKYKTKRRNPVTVILIIVLICGIIALAGYFGYRQFILSTHIIKYSDHVEFYSEQNGLDKYLVYTVIKTESSFDPNAVSNVGARGLMQIMPDTFEWIKFKLGDEDAVYSDMFDPEYNIRYGCYLLGYLYDEFGNIETTMAAYHAGRGIINEWLDDPEYSSDGEHLDVIPYADTKHYVNKIVDTIAIYKELYENN